MARLGALAMVLLLALVPAARAADLPATQRALAREMARAGAASGAYVADLGTGRRLYASRGDVPRTPASVNKLYTTAAALLTYGPEGHLVTPVLATAPQDADGIVHGDLILRGAGDPTFGKASAAILAQWLADHGLNEVTGSVVGDETAWDGLRGPPSSGFRTSGDVGPLSALAYDHGYAKGRFQIAPARTAAQGFADALDQAGVYVGGAARAGIAQAGTVPVATWTSPAIADITRAMDLPSDNWYAETLVKAIGKDYGGVGTTGTGAAVVRRTVARLGARPRIVDGSGLSRADATTPHDVVRLLAGIAGDAAAGPAFRASLPVAGRTGTLYKRMRRTSAQDRCQAKTGTLSNVSALAGYCDTTGGHRVAFAFLMNRISPTWAHTLQDRMTVALARYGDAPASP